MKQEYKYQGGYTFFDTYQTCQRAFWYRYVLRWEPEDKNAKMLWGNVIHRMRSLLAVPHEPESRSDMYDKVIKEEGLTIDADLVNRGWKLLSLWIDTYLEEDTKNWRPVFFDELLGIDIDGFNFLVKPDRVDYHPVKKEYRIIEIKATGYSAGVVLKDLSISDQVTAYIWGWNRKFPDRKINVVTPEVFYSRGQVYEVKRGSPIYRTDAQLGRFERDLKYWIGEIRYKLEAIRAGQKNIDTSAYFPRRFSCMSGSKFTCAYQTICSLTGIMDSQNPPLTFKIREKGVK